MWIKKNWLLAVSVAISIAAVVLVSLRIEPIEWNLASVLVAVLSILVTTLIVWQVYNVLDFRKVIGRVQIMEKDFEDKISRMNLLTNDNLSEIYYRFCTYDDSNLHYRYLYYSVVALMYASDLKDIKTCNMLVGKMLLIIKNPENIKMSQVEKDNIFGFISNVKNVKEIEKYYDLLRVLLQIVPRQF